MNSLYEFLMDELSDIAREFEDPSVAAHHTCILLSLDGHPIPETFFRLYTANLDLNHLILMNAAAYFSGAGILTIECDCEESSKSICDIHEISNTDFYHEGFKSACEGKASIERIQENLRSLRGKMLHAD